MDPNNTHSFMHLLTGDESHSERANSSHLTPRPPNWPQYPPPPNPPYYSQQYLQQYSQSWQHYQQPQNLPLQNTPPQNFSYGSMPPPCYPPQSPRTTSSSTRPPSANNPSPTNPSPTNPTPKESGAQPPKWTLDEDRRLVKSWINVSTNPITGADKKLAGFWTKVAYIFSQHAPSGATKRTGKVCNARCNRAAPLVSKWSACVAQAYRANQSSANEDDVMQSAQDLYVAMVGKTFDLMHWWLLLKDQPKWETFCNQSAKASTKRLRITESAAVSESDTPATPTTPNTPGSSTTVGSESTPTEEVGGLIRPMGRKAAKRKAKELGQDPLLEIVTRELSNLATTNANNSTMWPRYVAAQERKAEVAHEALKLRRMEYEDKILKMNIAEMCPEDRAHYGPMQEEIRSRYRQQSSFPDVDLSLD